VIPSTLFVALAAILAALVAGFFSFVNLVSAKENKVSEFRLLWIEGLRNEIACFTSAIQELSRIVGFTKALADDEVKDQTHEERGLLWMRESRQAYADVTGSLTRIQLRLNPKHVALEPASAEAKLMACIVHARDRFNADDFDDAYKSCVAIREAAAPLLKSTWDLVKNGEPRYESIRAFAQGTILGGIALVTGVFLAIVWTVLSGGSFAT
jgi:hypothetical protein